jgi:uncharacterized coiled-coil DUF342 family protein
LNSLKNELTQSREKLRIHISEAKKLSLELKKIASATTSRSIDDIKEEIERLEWMLITTPNLDLEEEKKIIEKISQLERKLKEISTYQRNSFELYTKYEELNAEIDKLKKEMKEKSNLANQIRDRITQLKNVRNKLKKDIEDVINSIKALKQRRDELKSKLNEVFQAINAKSKEYRDILKELNRLKAEREQIKAKTLLNRKKDEVKSRLERGERVTLYDLYVLYGEESKS